MNWTFDWALTSENPITFLFQTDDVTCVVFFWSQQGDGKKLLMAVHRRNEEGKVGSATFANSFADVEIILKHCKHWHARTFKITQVCLQSQISTESSLINADFVKGTRQQELF